MPRNSASFKELLQKGVNEQRATHVAKPNLETTVFAGCTALRLTHLGHTLLRQRDYVFADSKRLTTRGNVGLAVATLMLSFEAWVVGSVLAEKVKNNESLLSTTSDTRILEESAGSITGLAVVTGLNTLMVVRGRSFAKQRRLSAYGRAYNGLLAGASAASLALQIRSALK